jgi:chromosome segregation protein
MVHIKRVELSHFKSFGGTIAIPFLDGFTVVSGPNGSGKSNILDALLFCLGLASSKGMRAERLPDLVNHKQQTTKGTSEVSVSVTFDLSDWHDADLFGEAASEAEKEEDAAARGELTSEWTVTRRLRVTKSGGYTSAYFINGEPATATDLHEQLRRLRIYSEGYNVVLQGDVTRIITMNGRERREIIDELAGVAEFDRKIGQVRSTLDEVREQEDRFRLIEQELRRSLDRLAADRIKAEKYQALREQIHLWQQWEMVLQWKALQQQIEQAERQYQAGEGKLQQLAAQLTQLATEVDTAQGECDRLNAVVKDLGEDQQIAVNSELTKQRLQLEQLQHQEQDTETAIATSQQTQERLRLEIVKLQQRLAELSQTQHHLDTVTLVQHRQTVIQAQNYLNQLRDQSQSVAAASEAWVQEQTALTKQISTLQQTLNPQRTEQAQLQERLARLQQTHQEQTAQVQQVTTELADQTPATPADLGQLETRIQDLAASYAQTDAELKLTQDTQQRLVTEQRDRQRQLDRLEARTHAQQEAQGTHATQVILNAKLPGVCGLVAQLGQVEKPYQVALETAAGGRLGQIVVEDDRVAAQGIELLKRERAGRATFLPLNKIRAPGMQSLGQLRQARGFVDYAVKLVDCEPRYRPIFAYVFGSTAVFEDLATARSLLGKSRIVTLEGELLETSGALSGGSRAGRSTLHFGTAAAGESAELSQLRDRLAEIDTVLATCEQTLAQKRDRLAQLSQTLSDCRQTFATESLRAQQDQKERDRLQASLDHLQTQITQTTAAQAEVQTRLDQLAQTIPPAEAELAALEVQLAALETGQASSEWQAIQQAIQHQEQHLTDQQTVLRNAEAERTQLETQILRLQERIETAETQLATEQQQQHNCRQTLTTLQDRHHDLAQTLATTEATLAQLTAHLGTAKDERDRAAAHLNRLHQQQQSTTWERDKLHSAQQERKNAIAQLYHQVTDHEDRLPNPLPVVPDLISVELEDANPKRDRPLSFSTYAEQLTHLQGQIQAAQRRLEAMEPVNMLALDEHERTQTRLTELSEKLATLAAERTELLLRIETFTTLRLRAFRESFDAVNTNFQAIFATLSEGDGHLKLDNESDPFAGGLTLVAHPKGKPVQRLSSMSGGEKSLTALSFIFALQRYRPSPFYAFDEVDMFLDGANVERLAKMIKKQAEQAQFIVVSLRRPMIESSQRTIGVTQARGAYTQVLGIKL